MQRRFGVGALAVACVLAGLALAPALAARAQDDDAAIDEETSAPAPVEPEEEPAPVEEPEEPAASYDFRVDARIVATERTAHVRLTLGTGADKVEYFVFRIDPERHLDFKGSGTVAIDGDLVTWTPPRTGGSLRYRFRIEHLRNERTYDAWCTRKWALFRGDDLVPPARVSTLGRETSETRLRLRLPAGWAAATPYSQSATGDYIVDVPHRRFDRPTGWFAIGDIGVLREDLLGMRFAVAAPRSQHMRRNDILALMHWTAPALRDLLGKLPERFLIVGAGDPMWRGGLSAPGSAYLHSDRPLISADGTSPVLHEVLHSTLAARADDEYQWLVEGLVEYYSVVLQHRSGTISDSRFEATLDRHRSMARKQRRRRELRFSAGMELYARLDAAIRERTEGAHSLDDVAREIARRRASLSPESLAEMAKAVADVDVRDVVGARE